ncbi:MAG TPA: CDP-alcohol phosphatidyltransferase family protein [bacterium]|nr:CDP-alcohol phosphatidyltransferase family protein [bacterium]HQP99902.1 CDP-alcohol phosphatidyltransferase family protein [bacterium]
MMNIWTFANGITGSRIVFSPVFIVCFLWGGPFGKSTAFLIACLFEITDIVDGHIARRRREVSDLGKLLDPFADSISRFSIFLCLLAEEYVPVWMVALVFYRDALVSYLRVGAATYAVVMSARLSGKIKAVVQGFGTVFITFLIACRELGWVTWDIRQIAYWAMAVITVVTLWSAMDYLYGFSTIVSRNGKTSDS